VVHVVARGEGLLDLQDRYGIRWQRIAEANYGTPQPDGRALQRGQTRIYPGWQLRIPVSAAPAEAEPAGDRFVAGTGAADPVAASANVQGHLGAGTGPGTEVAANANEQGTPYEYEVAKGDWLWHISERYLGDPLRYPEIAALNPELAQRHGDFPDHIEPGWTIRLPADAVDSGPDRHATGTATPLDGTASPPAPAAPAVPPAEPPAPEEPALAEPAEPAGPAEQRPELAEPAPEAAGLGAAAPTGPDPHRSGFGDAPAPPPDPAPAPETETGPADAAEAELELLAPAALAGAGLLTALVLGAAALHRHRRYQHHRPGFRFASPAAQRLEKTLRTAQQPLDAARLDAALRQLAAGLANRPGALPDIAGALVDDGSVHLLLAAPCPSPPAPWRDHGDRWTLPAGVPVPAVTTAAALAPLPALAAIGSQAGIHLLLDLERLGLLTIHGDPVRALDLLRYLAAELACNSWSDAAEVLLAGFPPAEAQLLASINPDRVRVLPSVPEAAALLRQRAGSARTTLARTGAGDALAGRVRGLAGDAWMPQVLLAAAGAADLAVLTALGHELGGAGRCAVAVATTDPAPGRHQQHEVTVTPDGTVHVRLPFLHASLAAAALPVAELHPLAELMRATRTARQVPVPPAPEPEPWTVGTDAAGAVRAAGLATVGAPVAEITSVLPVIPATPASLSPDGDPRLDDDLQAWHDEPADRLQIAILGPVSVAAPGPAPATRRRLHTEFIVFLAQRASRGAGSRQIDAAMWPDIHVAETGRQLVISRARRWLGNRPDGEPWLPDVGADLSYRLADGYLLDWHLFRRLRTRAEMHGAAGTEDLRQALRLVRGVPLAGADRPAAPGTRNPYPWLAESDIDPTHLIATIVDTAHLLAERCLADGDPAGARWAVQQAWLADADRSYDQPWQDRLRAEHADGRTEALRAVLAELMEARDAETPEDLSPETYRLVSCWPPNVLVPAG
jgi:hypothetical protein